MNTFSAATSMTIDEVDGRLPEVVIVAILVSLNL